MSISNVQCAAPDCSNTVPAQRFGRRKLFCSARCRKDAHRRFSAKPSNDHFDAILPQAPIENIEQFGRLSSQIRKSTPPHSFSESDESPAFVIDILRRSRFIGRVHSDIVALLVPVDTALDEVRAGTGNPELTKAAFLNLLARSNIEVFANVDQFGTAKQALKGNARSTRCERRALVN